MRTFTLRTAAVLVLYGLVGCEPPAPAGISLETSVRRQSWRTPGGMGERLSTRHYDIFTTASRPRLAQAFPGFLEAAYANYLSLTALGDDPKAPAMPVYMLGSRQEWADLTAATIPADAAEYLSIEAGGYCYRGVCVFWDIGGSAVLSIAAHEGLHQFFHHRLADGLPMWLEEGMCVLAEGFALEGDRVRFTPEVNPYRFNDLREAIVHGRWIPIERLLPMDAGNVIGKGPHVAVGYYGQLWALAMFLRSNGRYRAGLYRMLADARAGKFHETSNVPPRALAELRLRGRIYNQTISEPLFRRYICDDLAAFEREFSAFARRIAMLE